MKRIIIRFLIVPHPFFKGNFILILLPSSLFSNKSFGLFSNLEFKIILNFSFILLSYCFDEVLNLPPLKPSFISECNGGLMILHLSFDEIWQRSRTTCPLFHKHYQLYFSYNLLIKLFSTIFTFRPHLYLPVTSLMCFKMSHLKKIAFSFILQSIDRLFYWMAVEIMDFEQ